MKSVTLRMVESRGDHRYLAHLDVDGAEERCEAAIFNEDGIRWIEAPRVTELFFRTSIQTAVKFNKALFAIDEGTEVPLPLCLL